MCAAAQNQSSICLDISSRFCSSIWRAVETGNAFSIHCCTLYTIIQTTRFKLLVPYRTAPYKVAAGRKASRSLKDRAGWAALHCTARRRVPDQVLFFGCVVLGYGVVRHCILAPVRPWLFCSVHCAALRSETLLSVQSQLSQQKCKDKQGVKLRCCVVPSYPRVRRTTLHYNIVFPSGGLQALDDYHFPLGGAIS